MWWGYSGALDIQGELLKAQAKPPKDELNILVVGNGDGRHILKTMAKSYSHNKRKLNFYVIEPTLELYARQMLMFSIALEPPDELGLLEKSRIFMEIYGNTLLRPTTSAYLTKKSSQLIERVTRLDNTFSIVSIDKLRYRERDSLENIFKFWKNCSVYFDLIHLWDQRIRKSLGVRYDMRAGAYDWDYYMRLQPLGGDKINKREYVHFRTCGVAFTWLETEYSRPNTSLASGILKLGDRLLHLGYAGDVMMGPFVTYGSDCEDADMLKKQQNVYVKRCTDITERNVRRMMHEIVNRTEYVHVPSSFDGENLGVTITEICENIEQLVIDNEDVTVDLARGGDAFKAVGVDNVAVHFLPVRTLDEMEKTLLKYANFFDVVSLSHYMDMYLNDDVMKMCRDGCLLMIETKLFVLGYKRDDLVRHVAQLTDQIDELSVKCVSVSDFNPLKTAVAKFIVKQQ